MQNPFAIYSNKQPIEKRTNISDGAFLEVHSIFYTIQGEGPFAGRPAIFIRLAGCNLQCPGCDTDYTNGRHVYSVDHVVDVVRELRKSTTHRQFCKMLVVITGGEPFRQNLTKLIMELYLYQFDVQIETNGTLTPFTSDPETHLSISCVTIVCSPKAGKIHPKLEPRIDAYKYVLSADSVDPDDGLPVLALGHSAAPRVARPRAGFAGPVYLQPMDSGGEYTNRRNLKAVIDSCLKYNYIVCTQLHKLFGME